MGLSQRRKGRGWEQQVARDLREAMPGADIRRGWQSRSGSDEPDVIAPLYWIECKAGRHPSPRAALRQAQAASPGGKWILAVIKDDRKEPFVVLASDDLWDIKNEVCGKGGTWPLAIPEWFAGHRPNIRTVFTAARFMGADFVVIADDDQPPLAVLRWADMLRIIGEHWRVAQK